MLNVVDFFCGAGGFSEGFRQMGCSIVYGYDHWKPAVDTFNHNFNLNCEVRNILEFHDSINQIDGIPNSEIIIGSPPCVSFSSSNNSGKADKTLGVELTETFLQIVAVKKYQPNSILEAWFMENVVNSKRYLKTVYTFKDLGLTEWAHKNNLSPLKIAIDLSENSTIINSADYGSFQARKRVISGEVIRKGKLMIPPTSHSENILKGKKKYLTIRDIKKRFPHPYAKESDEIISDPHYELKISQKKITDHFYDSGIYKVEWAFSRYWKTNHPYMGKMSFPENEDNPSRTITATKIANSRESIIYKSEVNRVGDGEYRLPTVREAAIIMGFPISFQFLGTENNKWRLVGNAVCSSVSRALAKMILFELNLNTPKELILNKNPKHVYAVESSTKIFSTLENNMKNYKNVTCLNYAIDNNGLDDCENDFDYVFHDKLYKSKAITFKTFLNKFNINKIDFLKIDIEGSEYGLFNSKCFDVLKSNVKFLVAEFHLGNTDLKLFAL